MLSDNGNESVAPEVILKMMCRLFFDDLPSERELMRTLPVRLESLAQHPPAQPRRQTVCTTARSSTSSPTT